MNVTDLMGLLQQHDPNATAVLWDRITNNSPCAAKLGVGEIQSVQLGTRESNRAALLEVWTHGFEQDGPFPGVVLGSP